jgi:protein-disulfide reductase (glutathione)
MFLPAALLLALCALSPASAHGGHGLHHGHHHGEEVSPSGGSGDAHATWGASIAWRSLAEGKAEALATGKPLMLLVWKTWCGACKSLRPRFAGSAAIAAAASDVVMVNLVDDEEPTGNDALYKPEGAGYS